MVQLYDKQIEDIKNEFPITIGKHLRAYRKEKKMTQIELASATEKDRQYIYRIEKGIVTINVATLKILLTALDVTLKEFFNDIE